jgi:hypothetical protein
LVALIIAAAFVIIGYESVTVTAAIPVAGAGAAAVIATTIGIPINPNRGISSKCITTASTATYTALMHLVPLTLRTASSLLYAPPYT